MSVAKGRAKHCHADPKPYPVALLSVTNQPHKLLRFVALFEAFKGAVVLIAGFGLLTFLGDDANDLAERIMHRLHVDPTHHYPHIFIRTMNDISDAHLWMLAGFALLYSTVRFFECYGLWHGRRWAEWFAALSGAIYVPVECYELAVRASWFKAAALVINLAIVAYMAWLLTITRRRGAAAAE